MAGTGRKRILKREVIALGTFKDTIRDAIYNELIVTYDLEGTEYEVAERIADAVLDGLDVHRRVAELPVEKVSVCFG
jgi:hypothetical protein